MPIRPHAHPRTGLKGYIVDVSRVIDGRLVRRHKVVYGSMRQAKDVEHKLQGELAERLAGHGRAITFATLVEAYRKHAAESKASFEKAESWILDRFEERWGRRVVADIDYDDIEKYRRARKDEKTKHGKKIAPATVNREITVLSAVFTYGVKSGRVRPPHNPCKYVDRLPEASPVHREITDEQLVKLCRGRADHVKRAMLIARFTGLRHSHVLALDWSQITDDGMIYPTATQAASRKAVGRIPIREGLLEVFGPRKASGRVITYKAGKKIRPVPVDSIRKAIQRASKKAGIPFRLHDLRASFHMELLRAGVDDQYRRVVLGWGKDLAFASTVEQRYARITDADLKAALSVLPSCKPIVNAIMQSH
ncbi:tyrosine-type recombinase/integrase [bacterium]|nr:tyrosine-type recombinase/integrase [bacterium]